MANQDLVINHRAFNYEGPFAAAEISKLIKKVSDDRGYKLIDRSVEVKITDEGKLRSKKLKMDKPFNKLTSFSISMKLNILVSKEELVSLDGLPKKVDIGKIDIIMDAWVKTEEKRYLKISPRRLLVQAFINKYIKRLGFISKPNKMIVTDADYIFNQISSYINLYKDRIEERKESTYQ